MYTLYYLNKNLQMDCLKAPSLDTPILIPEDLIFTNLRKGIHFIKEPHECINFTDMERLIINSEFFDTELVKQGEFRKQNTYLTPLCQIDEPVIVPPPPVLFRIEGTAVAQNLTAHSSSGYLRITKDGSDANFSCVVNGSSFRDTDYTTTSNLNVSFSNAVFLDTQASFLSSVMFDFTYSFVLLDGSTTSSNTITTEVMQNSTYSNILSVPNNAVKLICLLIIRQLPVVVPVEPLPAIPMLVNTPHLTWYRADNQQRLSFLFLSALSGNKTFQIYHCNNLTDPWVLYPTVFTQNLLTDGSDAGQSLVVIDPFVFGDSAVNWNHIKIKDLSSGQESIPYQAVTYSNDGHYVAP
ncbi:hypothetical protein [Flavobacterium marginilacus]|uniref:hypothetical protein n=1 Tax=Flavobacterium marginilacus TaxID=3003256 RepID=UPI00248E862E|nr:hypothetical protein [Flavobacterium marginilacus]